MIANVATTKEFGKKTYKSDVLRFSENALETMRRTSKNAGIYIHDSILVGKVTDSWVEDGRLFIEFEASDLYKNNYIVPSISISSRHDGLIKTARISGYLLTNEPSDDNIFDLNYTNSYFKREDGLIRFMNSNDEYSNEGFTTFSEANKQWLIDSELIQGE